MNKNLLGDQIYTFYSSEVKGESITINVSDIITLPDGRNVYFIPGPRGEQGLEGMRGKNGKSMIVTQYLIKVFENDLVYGITFTSIENPPQLLIENSNSSIIVRVNDIDNYITTSCQALVEFEDILKRHTSNTDKLCFSYSLAGARIHFTAIHKPS